MQIKTTEFPFGSMFNLDYSSYVLFVANHLAHTTAVEVVITYYSMGETIKTVCSFTTSDNWMQKAHHYLKDFTTPWDAARRTALLDAIEKAQLI